MTEVIYKSRNLSTIVRRIVPVCSLALRNSYDFGYAVLEIGVDKKDYTDCFADTLCDLIVVLVTAPIYRATNRTPIEVRVKRFDKSELTQDTSSYKDNAFNSSGMLPTIIDDIYE